VTPVAFVINGNSAAPHDLRAMFRQWQEKAWPVKSETVNIIDLDAAFDMLDRERYSIRELQGDSLPLGVEADKIEVRSPLHSIDISIS
jgi:hypothetical protein